jgi:hypothetical protein
MWTFDELSEKALADEPIYHQIVVDKIDGM